MKTAPTVESIRVGIDALVVHPARTLLSTIGVFIGIMALTATFAVIDGVDVMGHQILLRESSVQDVLITPRVSADPYVVGRLHDRPTLTLDDLTEARTAIPRLAGASLAVAGSTTMAYGAQHRRVRLLLATANLPSLEDLPLLGGRFYTDAEVLHDLPVVVLGHHLAAELAQPRDPLILIGRAVRIREATRTVVGILTPRAGEQDFVAFGPLSGRTDAMRLLGAAADVSPALRLKAGTPDEVTAVRDAALEWIGRRFGVARTAFDVTIGLERLERAKQSILLSKLIFGLLVALMLAVGGVGIMNVMLTSVTERTREIGMQKSVGARSAAILVQFLTESIVISGTGALLGFAAGVPVALGAGAGFRGLTHAELYPVFSASTVFMVAVSAVVVGTAFGTYPALRAARLPPVIAMARD